MKNYKDIVARFIKYVDRSGECHLWTGYKDVDGYGRFRLGASKARANRVAFQLFKGKIPKDLIVRHTCDNPTCVNPKHLILGTPKDNVKDAWARERNKNNHFYVQKNKTTCTNGHPFDIENTYVWKNHRFCKACRRSRSNSHYHRGKNNEKTRSE